MRNNPERLALAISIGEKIRQARKEAKVSQVQLAKACGCGSAYICDIEKGKKLPHLVVLYKISKVIKLDWINI